MKIEVIAHKGVPKATYTDMFKLKTLEINRLVIRARVGDGILDFCRLLIALATLDAVCLIMAVVFHFSRNVPVPGSNVVDLVNDALKKTRKSFQPVGWKMFARGLKDVNAPMDLIGNPERWIYIQTTTPCFAGGATKETTPIAGSSGRRPSSSSSRIPRVSTPLQHMRWDTY